MSAATLEWLDQGKCIGHARFTDWPEDDQQAMCAQCPVRNLCLERGMAAELLADPADGVVYGGMTTRQRRQLRRNRARS